MELNRDDILEIMKSFEASSMTKLKYTNEKESLVLERQAATAANLAVGPAITGCEAANAEGFQFQGGKEAKEAVSMEAKPAGGPEAKEAGSTIEQPESSLEVQTADDVEAQLQGTLVTAPMPGVFYRSKEPGAAPYAEPGQRVLKGDTLGLMEAMKMMSEVPSPVSGTVISIQADNGQFLEYDGPIMVIRED